MLRSSLSRPALRGIAPVLAAGLVLALAPAAAVADTAPTIQDIHGSTRGRGTGPPVSRPLCGG